MCGRYMLINLLLQWLKRTHVVDSKVTRVTTLDTICFRLNLQKSYNTVRKTGLR